MINTIKNLTGVPIVIRTKKVKGVVVDDILNPHKKREIKNKADFDNLNKCSNVLYNGKKEINK